MTTSLNAQIEREEILEVRDLNVHFPVRKTGLFGSKVVARAVNGVSFEVMKGETLGLVGESGCGKSTLGRLVMALLPPTGGRIVFAGEDLAGVSRQRIGYEQHGVVRDAIEMVGRARRGLLCSKAGAQDRQCLQD